MSWLSACPFESTLPELLFCCFADIAGPWSPASTLVSTGITGLLFQAWLYPAGLYGGALSLPGENNHSFQGQFQLAGVT